MWIVELNATLLTPHAFFLSGVWCFFFTLSIDFLSGLRPVPGLPRWDILRTFCFPSYVFHTAGIHIPVHTFSPGLSRAPNKYDPLGLSFFRSVFFAESRRGAPRPFRSHLLFPFSDAGPPLPIDCVAPHCPRQCDVGPFNPLVLLLLLATSCCVSYVAVSSRQFSPSSATAGVVRCGRC